MPLEDYFDFEKFPSVHGEVERIRIKGHRIAIEHVLEHYKQGLTAEAIHQDIYPTLTLEEIDATIHYYLQHQAEVDDYLERGRKMDNAFYQDYLKRGPYFLKDDALASVANSERQTDV